MPTQEWIRPGVAALLVCLYSTSLAAQESRVAIRQTAPLPVIALAVDDNEETLAKPVRFSLTVDAQCTNPSEGDSLVLAIADQTFSRQLQDMTDAPVDIAVQPEQLAGLQVDTLCKRRLNVGDDSSSWLLSGAFGVQATLICASGNPPAHVTAAIPVDVTVDCAMAYANSPTETPPSDPTPNQQPAD